MVKNYMQAVLSRSKGNNRNRSQIQSELPKRDQLIIPEHYTLRVNIFGRSCFRRDIIFCFYKQRKSF